MRGHRRAGAPDHGPTRAHWVLLVLSVLAPLVVLSLGALLDPDPRGHGTHEQLGIPPCAAMFLYGIPCPGCGVTTAVTLVGEGSIASAFVVQPFGALLALGSFVAGAFALWAALRGRDLGVLLLTRSPLLPALLVGGALVGAWAYRVALALAP